MAVTISSSIAPVAVKAAIKSSPITMRLTGGQLIRNAGAAPAPSARENASATIAPVPP